MKNNPYLKNLKYCIFDIETTGLHPSADIVISVSFCDPDTGETDQLFTDSPLLEKNTIAAVLEKLSAFDAVITYNGNRFDLPFVMTRAKKYGLEGKMPMIWPIDLYLWLKKYWPAAQMMESLRQKAVENALGVAQSRTDMIDGGECIPLYSRYLALGDDNARDTILLHNADDVRQLAKVSQRINFLPWAEIAFNEGYLAYVNHNKVMIGKGSLKKNRLICAAEAAAEGLGASFITDDYSLEYDAASGKISLSITLEELDGLSFIDLSRLPLNMADFEDLTGFHEGFLIVRDGSGPLFKEACRLIFAIISLLF